MKFCSTETLNLPDQHSGYCYCYYTFVYSDHSLTISKNTLWNIASDIDIQNAGRNGGSDIPKKALQNAIDNSQFTFRLTVFDVLKVENFYLKHPCQKSYMMRQRIDIKYFKTENKITLW